jgi:hypothetical protein
MGMGLDIRLPIGMMFSLIGALLIVYGLVTGSDLAMYQASLNLNVNLGWGAVLFLFGAVMLFFGLRATHSSK